MLQKKRNEMVVSIFDKLRAGGMPEAAPGMDAEPIEEELGPDGKPLVKKKKRPGEISESDATSPEEYQYQILIGPEAPEQTQ